MLRVTLKRDGILPHQKDGLAINIVNKCVKLK